MQVKDSNSRDPSAMELPNARGGIFSFPQTAPPPTASHCWTGSGHVNVEGTKHPALLAAARLVAESASSPHRLEPQMLSGCQFIRNAQSEVSLSTHFSSSAPLTSCMEGHVMVSKKNEMFTWHVVTVYICCFPFQENCLLLFINK